MKVIIVDDHAMIRDGIKWMLVNEPSIEIVGEAADGREAVIVAAETQPDVVLMDVRMPEVSGLEALVDIKQRWPHMAVLMLTMYSEASLIAAAVEQGASGYLLKNAGRDEMIRAIHQVAEGRSYLQPDLAEPFIRLLQERNAPAASLRLSPLEGQILKMVAAGLGNQQIATELHMTLPSVKAALQRVFKALEVTGRPEAVAAAFRLGLIS